MPLNTFTKFDDAFVLKQSSPQRETAFGLICFNCIDRLHRLNLKNNDKSIPIFRIMASKVKLAVVPVRTIVEEMNLSPQSHMTALVS